MARPPRRASPDPDLEKAASRLLQEKRGRPALKPAPSAGKAAARVLRPLAQRHGPGVESLKKHWPEIVGERLAEWCEPEGIQGAGANGVLAIRARGPAGALIQAAAPRILQKIKLFAGDGAPGKLRVLQGALNRKDESRTRTGSSRPIQGPDEITERKDASHVSEGVEQDAQRRLASLLERWGEGYKSRPRR